MDVYDDMNLYLTREFVWVEPNGQDECLRIDRTTAEVRLQASLPAGIQNPTRRICGILGTIQLNEHSFLLVATDRLYVGTLNGAIIWRLAGYDFIPFTVNALVRASDAAYERQIQLQETYLQMLRKTLDTQYFYFSYRHDLTQTQQRRYEQGNTLSSLDTMDERFVWNASLLRNFKSEQMRQFQLPLIMGFISINQVDINGRNFFWSIISRRSIQRAGTRLFCRGANDNGHVANYVETEQIVEFNGECVSFVQTRGSMPFFWRQLPNIRYKPAPQLVPAKDHVATSMKHFDAQIHLYGRQVLVNLINQTGAEGMLAEAFRTIVQKLNNPQLRYEAFDFHAECKKMRWDRLNILIDRLAHEQDEFGVFHIHNGNIIDKQRGVFRTNCIDCLDRTNVVQSMLAKRSLNGALQRLGILSVGQRVESASPKFEMIFKGVWADNADVISLQYSGTGALKTDFTRTGKRTKGGLLQDGVNSLTRYYLNNFADGFRQDGIDLFLCNYRVGYDEYPSPLIKNSKRGWRYNTFPAVLLFAIAMFFISAMFPSEFDTGSLLFLLFWGAMIGVSTTGILHYNVEFVDWPRLCPPIKIEA